MARYVALVILLTVAVLAAFWMHATPPTPPAASVPTPTAPEPSAAPPLPVPAPTPAAPSTEAAPVPGLALRGQVVDEQGVALAGAEVRLYAENGGEPLAITNSADEGRFEFPIKEMGDFLVVAEQNGKVALEAAEQGMLEVTLTLRARSTIRGIVLRADDAPVSDCSVTLHTAIEGGGSGLPETVRVFLNGGQESATTGADGTFRFQIGAGGPYRVEAVHEEFGQADSGLVVFTPELPRELELRLHLAIPVSVSGTVSDSRGRPVQGAHIEIANDLAPNVNPPKNKVRSAESDASGRFTIEKVLPGANEFRVTADSFSDVTDTIEVPEGGLQQWKIVLYRGATIRGRYLADGRLWADIGIQIITENGSGEIDGARTDSTGQFERTGLLPGQYLLIAHGPNAGFQTVPYHLTLEEGQTKTVDLGPDVGASISGRLVGVPDGVTSFVRLVKPGGAPSLDIMGEEGPGQFERLQDLVGQTLAQGDSTFELQGLPPGTYDLEVYSLRVNTPNDSGEALRESLRTPVVRTSITVGSDPVDIEIAVPNQPPTAAGQ